MIFRAVGDGRPYPEHGRESARDWADVPPRMVRLDELVTTKRNLDLATLLSEESTFYGDLFAHVVIEHARGELAEVAPDREPEVEAPRRSEQGRQRHTRQQCVAKLFFQIFQLDGCIFDCIVQ